MVGDVHQKETKKEPKVKIGKLRKEAIKPTYIMISIQLSNILVCYTMVRKQNPKYSPGGTGGVSILGIQGARVTVGHRTRREREGESKLASDYV